MRTKKEMKDLEFKLSEVCEAVRNNFKLGLDIDIHWLYGMKRDPTQETYRKMIPSGDDTIRIDMKRRK